MKPNIPIDPWREPSAAMRESARNLRELYVSMVNEGFTPEEARQMLVDLIKAAKP